MTESLGEMVRAAMLMHQRHAARAAPIAEGYLRTARFAGNEAQVMRWNTILQTVRELDRQ